jgi:O-antigen/teichoic acid export membrane protein
VGYFVWAYVASYAITIAYSLVVIRVFRLGDLRLRLDRALVMRWLPLALPFALTSFLTNLYFDADRVILPIFRPFAEVGWYNLAYKPYEALQFVPLAIQVVVYPLLGVYFVADPARLKVAYARFFKALVLLGWPLTVGTFVLVHGINAIFNRSGAFAQSESALRILAFGIVFLFSSSAFYAMLNATNRQQFNAVATGLAAVINIVLNLIFIPFYGYLAASTTTVITEAALCAFGWWFVQRGRPDLRLPVIALSWRVLLAGAIMGAAVYFLRDESILLSVPAGFLVYLVAILIVRAVDAEEWELLMEGLLARLRRNPPEVIVVGSDGKA